MSNQPPDQYIYYRYSPSLAAATIFTTLFSLSTILHIFQASRHRASFLTPFIMGGIFEATGYIGRILSSSDRFALGPYIMQTLLLLLAPALFAASIYMTLGRLIRLVGAERYSLFAPRWLTKIFVAGDVAAFMVQGAGGGIMAAGDLEKRDLGQKLIVAGLFLQIAFFGLFGLVAVLFQIRGREHLGRVRGDVPWRRIMCWLYFASALILVRSAIRAAQYIEGNDGYLLRHEVFLYVFDGLLMLTVMVAGNLVNLGQIAPMFKARSREGQFQKPVGHMGHV